MYVSAKNQIFLKIDIDYDDRDYRGLKKCIRDIHRAQEGSKVNLNEAGPPREDRSRASEERDGANASIVTPPNTIPRSEQESGSSRLTRRRDSTKSRRMSIAQQAIPSIKWSKSRPSKILTFIGRYSSNAKF
jgi:hypothetical protein